MSDVTDSVTQKAGPFPVWVWGLGLGGLYVLYRYWKVSQQAKASPVAEAVGLTPLDTTPNISASPDLTNGGTSSTGGATTNAQWVAEAVQGLIDKGYDPLHIEQALQDYLAGNDLSYQESQIVNGALAEFGVPPEGGATIGNIAQAPPKTTTPPPASPNYGPTGESVSDIAQKGYGTYVRYAGSGNPSAIWWIAPNNAYRTYVYSPSDIHKGSPVYTLPTSHWTYKLPVKM